MGDHPRVPAQFRCRRVDRRRFDRGAKRRARGCGAGKQARRTSTTPARAALFRRACLTRRQSPRIRVSRPVQRAVSARRRGGVIGCLRGSPQAARRRLARRSGANEPLGVYAALAGRRVLTRATIDAVHTAAPDSTPINLVRLLAANAAATRLHGYSADVQTKQSLMGKWG
jgi:DNA-directed RNA polymerase subunit H (RpoH/RPB5)